MRDCHEAGKSLVAGRRDGARCGLQGRQERQRPGVWGLFTVWWGGMGRLSLKSGTWLLCGVHIMGKGLGKAVRKTCS